MKGEHRGFSSSLIKGIGVSYNRILGEKDFCSNVSIKMGSIFELIFTGVGGFICWVLNGSKGSIKLELSKPYDRDFRYYRNYFVGISFLLFVIFVFYGIFK